MDAKFVLFRSTRWLGHDLVNSEAPRICSASSCVAQGTLCVTWRLLYNHVTSVPWLRVGAGPRATMAEAHWRTSRCINFREGWRGYRFQGRFAITPIEDALLMAAVRQVENCPVTHGMAAEPGD